MKVFILHPGKANYPEIAAYTNFLLRRGFEVYNGDRETYNNFPDKGKCVLWCIMGFYRAHDGEPFVVHDYRSLSLGPLDAAKDYIKRAFNAKPDLRVFQNSRMRDAMNFRDNIPSALLPMGVPDWIFDLGNGDAIESHKSIPAARFCYIGEMSRERGFDKLLSAWSASRGESGDRFVLVGRPEQEIYDAFKDSPGVDFVGRVSQREALNIVRLSEYAVCYFPYHRPHCFQTPTKLLEYAALGKKILCNDAPSNIVALQEMGIQSLVAGRYIFDQFTADSELDIERNDPLIMRKLAWSEVINESGVIEYLEEVRHTKDTRSPNTGTST